MFQNREMEKLVPVIEAEEIIDQNIDNEHPTWACAIDNLDLSPVHQTASSKKLEEKIGTSYNFNTMLVDLIVLYSIKFVIDFLISELVCIKNEIAQLKKINMQLTRHINKILNAPRPADDMNVSFNIIYIIVMVLQDYISSITIIIHMYIYYNNYIIIHNVYYIII